MAPLLTSRSRRGTLPALAVMVAVLLASCATGERPSLEPDSAPPTAVTGNGAIDDVLGLLDSVDDSEFTAGYAIETKFNTVSSTGLVVIAAGPRRSVTIENDDRSVRFIEDAGEERTCDLVTGECESILNDARISDTQLPHTFYGSAFASRLRADAERRISEPVAYTLEIAGQTAECVDVGVTGGTKTYCALPSGPLAKFVGADVTVDLTSYSPDPDVSKFATT